MHRQLLIVDRGATLCKSGTGPAKSALLSLIVDPLADHQGAQQIQQPVQLQGANLRSMKSEYFLSRPKRVAYRCLSINRWKFVSNSNDWLAPVDDRNENNIRQWKNHGPGLSLWKRMITVDPDWNISVRAPKYDWTVQCSAHLQHRQRHDAEG